MRLFVAVNLPDDVRQSIWNCAAPLRGRSFPIKWVAPESLHLTLKFLGDAPERQVSELAERIDRAVRSTVRFQLPIAGFGAFPNPRRARVVWIGCASVSDLQRTRANVESEMAAAGFPRDSRSFHPHLTLGRVRRDVKPAALGGLADQLQRLHFESQPVVESIDLMQSELSRSGASYTRLHAAILGAT